MLPGQLRVQLITDRRRTRLTLVDRVTGALERVPRGSVMVQLREKDLEDRALLALAAQLLPLCRARGAPLLVNDRLDIALALDLDGVHLPASSFAVSEARAFLGARKLVGVSCHSKAEVAAARDAGADYALLGPVFETASKKAFGPPLGVEAFAEAAALQLPLFAIGGVTAVRVGRLREAGAQGVAVIGAWMEAEHPGAAVEQLVAG